MDEVRDEPADKFFQKRPVEDAEEKMETKEEKEGRKYCRAEQNTERFV